MSERKDLPPRPLSNGWPTLWLILGYMVLALFWSAPFDALRLQTVSGPDAVAILSVIAIIVPIVSFHSVPLSLRSRGWKRPILLLWPLSIFAAAWAGPWIQTHVLGKSGLAFAFALMFFGIAGAWLIYCFPAPKRR